MDDSITAEGITLILRSLGSEERARVMQRYFKTGPGEYGEGDLFVGNAVPQLRKLARAYVALSLSEITLLLHSPIHEARLLALLILCEAYSRGDGSLREGIYRLYLANTRFINNWDLVDLSAPSIVGTHLKERSRTPLYPLAASSLIWERRIAIMATFSFIKAKEFAETLAIAERLLDDPEDLIHKAVGWMLREVGKRDQPTLEGFLAGRCRRMPRTMLRYAVERFPEDLRQAYLRGDIDD